MSSRHRRVDKRTPEEKARDKLKYHEDHHVTVKQFKDRVHKDVKSIKALNRLGKALHKAGPNAILSWQDARDPAISYTYTYAQHKADSDFVQKRISEHSDFFRLSRSRPGVKSSANTTPTAIGPVLQGLFFPQQAGYYATVPAGVNIPNGSGGFVAEGTDIMSLLPLASRGLVLRSTLLEVFYLYAWLRQLDDPNDGRLLRIDEPIAAAFAGNQPALFTKAPVGAPKPKRTKSGEVVMEQKYERAANPNNLNTLQAILTYKPNYHPRYGNAFVSGQYMGSSDFQIISALNYYSSAESQGRVQQILQEFQAAGTPITPEQLQAALHREYEILRAVRKYYKTQRDNDPNRQAVKKAKSDAAKANRKAKPKTGAVTVDIGNGRSMVQYVAPQPTQLQAVNI